MLKNNYILTILKKALDINAKSPAQDFIGNVVNLIQTDCQKFEEYGFATIYGIWTFFYIIFVMAASVYLLKWVILVYIGVSFIFLAISAYLYSISAKLQLLLMEKRDTRISLLNNIFNNIKFVKFTVLENFFCKYVFDYKKKEIKILKKIYIVVSMVVLINWISPNVSLVATLGVYFMVFKAMSLQ